MTIKLHKSFSPVPPLILGILCLFFLIAAPGTVTVARAAQDDSGQSGQLIWHSDSQQVNADLQSWELPRLLEQIAGATGWKVFLEPGIEHRVTVKFNSLPPREALARLLGNLNYAVLPQANGPPNLYVYQTALSKATQEVEPREPEEAEVIDTSQPIPDELVISLTGDSRQSIEALAKSLGARITGRIDELGAYRLQFDSAEAANRALELLQENPDVAEVDRNFPVQRPTRMDPLTGGGVSIPRLNLKAAAGDDPLIIGLIDSALHRQGGQLEDFLLPTLSVAGEATSDGSRPTHADSMWQTLLKGISLSRQDQQSLPVRVLPVDVYGPKSHTTTFDLAKGVYAATEQGARLINLSLGSDGNSSLMENLIRQGHEQGVLFFAAAGNESTSTPHYPAAYPEVIAVTAGDSQGRVATYANHGEFVDVIAPGTSFFNFGQQVYLNTGTSVSTAYATGLAAGLASESGQSLDQVESRIRKELAFSDKEKKN